MKYILIAITAILLTGCVYCHTVTPEGQEITYFKSQSDKDAIINDLLDKLNKSLGE